LSAGFSAVQAAMMRSGKPGEGPAGFGRKDFR